MSLLELLIALAILAVLTALVVPSYQTQVRLARRSAGQRALLEIAVAQERFRSHCSQYASSLEGSRACDAESSPAYSLGLDRISRDGHYRLSLADVSASGYRALAEPIGSQSKDAAGTLSCSPLSIDQDGQRRPEACW